MDLFFELSKTVQKSIFSFTDGDTEYLKQYIARLSVSKAVCRESIEDISRFGLSKLPVASVQFQFIHNPYLYWHRRDSEAEFYRKCSKDTLQVQAVPKGKLKLTLNPQVAYIVDGFRTKGAYASVCTLVVYQKTLSVVKMMDFDEFDWFEMVTQAYLYEKCKSYSFIRVPRILFLQRSKTYGTYSCMERASGKPIHAYSGIRLYAALAHAMKALYQLQKDVHFMHRDLSGQNIYYDASSHVITFIDFGMSWLNPTRHNMPWQMVDDTFYDWRSDTEINRSLDASTLIAHASLLDTWIAELHTQMKDDYKKAIEMSSNSSAKQQLSPPRRETQYTTIRNGRWHVGNELKPWDAVRSEGDGPHWWLFNMSKFRAPKWFPENVLKRLLRKLPLDHWFPIRRNWEAPFDLHMPKDVKVVLDDGTVGTLLRLGRSTCHVCVGNKIVLRKPHQCKQL